MSENMPLNCKACGAPLKGDEDRCPYCGTLIEHESQSGRENKNLFGGYGAAQVKYSSVMFTILASIFTGGLYGIYWYITRRKDFNALVDGLKFPDIAFVIYIIGWFAVFFIPTADYDMLESVDFEDVYDFTNIGYIIIWVGAIWLSFGLKKILLEFLKRHSGEAALKLISFSDIALFLFGYIYLQVQINKMIKAEILSPKL